MTAMLRWPIFRYALFIFAASAAAFLLLPSTRNLFAAVGLPHATCYLQNPQMIWLHASSDTLIGTAYLAISSTLAYLVYRARRDIPFHWMFLAFGLFIVTCGFTHFMEVWTVWQPVYWFAGYVKLITAIASVATAIVLPPVVPKVIHLIRAAKLSEERKVQLEESIREQERLYSRLKEMDEMKSRFFANVSHELRTPLTLIMAPSQKLQSATNLTTDQHEDVSTILRNARGLLKQVNELLDAAKLEAGKMQVNFQRVDLAQVVRLNAAQFQSLAESRRIEYAQQIPDGLEVESDPEKVERILLNMLSNAFKFTPDGGRISCAMEATNGRCVIQVADSGPGVPPEMREVIFERFRQLDNGGERALGGTGLGLAISKEFAELLGGSIRVESSPYGGALFEFELPMKAPATATVRSGPIEHKTDRAEMFLAEHHAATERPEAPATAASATAGTVLVVEDNLELNSYVADALRREYQVLRAFDGQEGLEMARSSEPDVIVSDVMMPRMSGEELLREVRSHPVTQQTPFIFLTAKADDQFKVRLLRSGAQDFVTKPFVVDELRARVANLAAINRTRKLLQHALSAPGGNIVELVNEALARKTEAETARAELRELNETLERRVKERTAELAEANHELTAFTSSVSHDLRAPLRTMRGMAEVLLETLGDDTGGEAKNYAVRIMNGALKMDTLLNDLLTYARLGKTDVTMGAVALETVLSQVLTEFAADIAQRDARVEIAPSLPDVHGNPTLLKQVFANLIGNALKYVPSDRRPEVRVRAEENGERVRLWVEDNGLGVPDEYQQKIFEPFRRLHSDTAYPGTGLGLSIALKALKKMDGEIGLESEPGVGSRFWVDLKKHA